MTAKVHVHMHVSDLAKSREFYERFFGARPGQGEARVREVPARVGPGQPGAVPGRPAPAPGPSITWASRSSPPRGARRSSRASRPPGSRSARRWASTAATPTRTSSGSRTRTACEWEVYHLNYDLEERRRPRRRAGGRPELLPIAEGERLLRVRRAAPRSRRGGGGRAWLDQDIKQIVKEKYGQGGAQGGRGHRRGVVLLRQRVLRRGAVARPDHLQPLHRRGDGRPARGGRRRVPRLRQPHGAGRARAGRDGARPRLGRRHRRAAVGAAGRAERARPTVST